MITIKNKLIVSLLMITLILAYCIPLQADVIPIQGLRKVEEQLYGNVSDAAILQKVDTLELAIFGHKTKGSIATRAQEIINYILSDDSQYSLMLLIPYMEKTLYNKTADGAIINRIEELEIGVYGEVQKGAIVTRVENLSSLLVTGNNNFAERVFVPKGKEIHIKTEDEINTAYLKPGELINFTIANDITVDGYLIIPAGTTGNLLITEFKKAGNFGKDASINIKINDIVTLDGSKLSLNLKLDDQENNSQEMAIGVSFLSTVIISNPIGLVAGYFLKGKDLVIPAGTVINAQVYESKEVYGFTMQ